MPSVDVLAKWLADACYVFLTVNFLWGLYCVVVLWIQLKKLTFRSDQEQLEYLGHLETHLNARNFEAAAQSCQDDVRALPQLALVTISQRALKHDQLCQLVAELMQRDVLARLEHKLSWIATVIKSGPLLGLFGTVLGMMAAFSVIGTGKQVKPEMIAHEISVALICTAMGLATAIPFSYFLANLAIRVRMLQESLNFAMTRFLDFFRDVQAPEDTRRSA